MSKDQQEGIFSWAYNHSDPANPKYSTNSHAIFISISGTLLFLLCTFIFRNTIFSSVSADYPIRE